MTASPLAVPRFNAPLIKEALGVEHRDQLCSPAHLNNLILSPHGVDVQLRRFVEVSDINDGSCLVVYRTIRCDDVVVDHKDGERCRNTLVLGLEGFAGQATYGVYQTRLGALWDCSGCVNRNVGESYMENSLICTTGPLIMAHYAPLMWLKGVGGGWRVGWAEEPMGNQNQ
ncbi:hypothetical protein N7489_010642 [Penicillium chrysogenum]|uniref:Uncharacterized protein n=1 Tax=Penicillium chrysogenum TaxID=5076 RepID=A0ABQ8WTW1_PENCH|nr:uncharacterized protein N7489_010642 [Penicillium chrysogenum]KAJ5229934.1 hypothetical protein N7489_010642 [Penicillium chrysogenum]KAJ5271609.1 hypothetical protein N7524_004878 [Penicillium chrysogenum]KAJ5282172.1 hypothetical protein N7505_000152 [Penicillium chrysogenum]